MDLAFVRYPVNVIVTFAVITNGAPLVGGSNLRNTIAFKSKKVLINLNGVIGRYRSPSRI